MSRITPVLDELRSRGRKALIPYLVAGDPDSDTTLALMHELVRQGADIIELGIPFSDPSSDGPVIQLGAERALKGGMTLPGVLDLVARFRRTDVDTPIVLMGYLNPVEVMGYQAFASRAAQTGVDGVLLVDLPVGESGEWMQASREHGIDTIFLVAPTTPASRVEAICDRSSGYLYYISLKGVTGAAIADPQAIGGRVASLKEQTELPVMVGFGIKDERSAVAMAAIADGIIVGSALVGAIAALKPGDSEAGAISEAVSLAGRIRSAIDQA
ncbi:MAG: tryptophan synthase subunit alpha [Pseudomonadota bacterium]